LCSVSVLSVISQPLPNTNTHNQSPGYLRGLEKMVRVLEERIWKGNEIYKKEKEEGQPDEKMPTNLSVY
jgi:hypothetical protein